MNNYFQNKKSGRELGGEFTQLLFQNGADITARDNQDRTPYDIAIANGKNSMNLNKNLI